MPRDMSTSSASHIPQGQYSDASAPPKRKHICPTCERGFTTSGHLARHTRIHTGERNHKCPFPGCETRCSRQDNLQQHYRIHLSPGSRRTSRSARQNAAKSASHALSESTSPPPTVGERSLSPPPLSAPPPLAVARPTYHHHARSSAPDSPPPLAYSSIPYSRHTSHSPELAPYSPQTLSSPVLVPDHTATTGPPRGYATENAGASAQYRMNAVASYHEHPQVSTAYPQTMPMQLQLDATATYGSGYHQTQSHSHAAPSQAAAVEGSQHGLSTRHGGYYSQQHQQHQVYHGSSEGSSPESSSSPPTPTQDLYHAPQPHHHRQSYVTSELQHAGYSPGFPVNRYQQPSPPPVLPPIRRELYEHQHQLAQDYRSYSDHGSNTLDSQWKSDGRHKISGMLIR